MFPVFVGCSCRWRPVSRLGRTRTLRQPVDERSSEHRTGGRRMWCESKRRTSNSIQFTNSNIVYLLPVHRIVCKYQLFCWLVGVFVCMLCAKMHRKTVVRVQQLTAVWRCVFGKQINEFTWKNYNFFALFIIIIIILHTPTTTTTRHRSRGGYTHSLQENNWVAANRNWQSSII